MRTGGGRRAAAESFAEREAVTVGLSPLVRPSACPPGTAPCSHTAPAHSSPRSCSDSQVPKRTPLHRPRPAEGATGRTRPRGERSTNARRVCRQLPPLEALPGALSTHTPHHTHANTLKARLRGRGSRQVVCAGAAWGGTAHSTTNKKTHLGRGSRHVHRDDDAPHHGKAVRSGSQPGGQRCVETGRSGPLFGRPFFIWARVKERTESGLFLWLAARGADPPPNTHASPAERGTACVRVSSVAT